MDSLPLEPRVGKLLLPRWHIWVTHQVAAFDIRSGDDIVVQGNFDFLVQDWQIDARHGSP